MIAFLFNRMIVLGIGFGLAIAFGLHLPGGDHFAAGMAISLGIIGAIYLGTLLRGPVGTARAGQEIAAAGVTFFFVAAGSYLHVLWLVPGFFFHAMWDWAHHDNRFGAEIVTWYPPFCAAVDFVMGLVVLYWWWPQ